MAVGTGGSEQADKAWEAGEGRSPSWTQRPVLVGRLLPASQTPSLRDDPVRTKHTGLPKSAKRATLSEESAGNESHSVKGLFHCFTLKCYIGRKSVHGQHMLGARVCEVTHSHSSGTFLPQPKF